MTGEGLAILFFALFASVSALYACTTRKIFHTALGVFMVLGSLAGIFLILGAEFLAVVQIILYLGGVIVLIVFGIMLTPARTEEKDPQFVNWSLMNSIAIGILTAFLAFLFWHYKGQWRTGTAPDPFSDYSASFAKISDLLFNEYLIPFEVLSVALLVALVGALTLARKKES